MLSRTFPAALLTWGITTMLGLLGPSVFGQMASFVASVDAKEVVVGVPFEVAFTLTDAEGQRFTPPSFRDFKIEGTVSESRGMSFIKGQTRSKQTWNYTLEAKRAGVFSIDAATVLVGGRVMTTAPVTIKVVAPSAAPKGAVAIPPGRDDQVFITGSVNTQKIFPGQQVIWRLTLYTRVAIEGADLISLPDFEGFYSKERRRFDTRTQYQTIQGKKYAVKTLHEEVLFAQSVGEVTIGVAQIRVGLDQSGTQGFFFGPKPVTLTTQPVTLTVAPLPEPIPANFTGGVGHYEWEVTTDTSDLSTDDALTLTIALKGNGDARRFAAPKIEVPPTCEIFEPRMLEEEEYESESEIIHTKRLEYVILPKEPGSLALTPQLTYFDIDSNRYCTLSTASIKFKVIPGKNYRPPNDPDTIAVPVQPTLQTGIGEKVVNIILSPVFWGVALLLGLSYWVYFLVKKRGKKAPRNRQMDQVVDVQQRFDVVGKLLIGTPPEVFYNELLKSLQFYIASRLNLMPAQLNQTVLRAKLAERHITPICTQAFLAILQTCEQAVFSGHTDATQMESDWRAATAVVQALEKEMNGVKL